MLIEALPLSVEYRTRFGSCKRRSLASNAVPVPVQKLGYVLFDDLVVCAGLMIAEWSSCAEDTELDRDLLHALREQRDAYHKLQAYMERLTLRVLENNPSLLEIDKRKVRSQSGGFNSAFLGSFNQSQGFVQAAVRLSQSGSSEA